MKINTGMYYSAGILYILTTILVYTILYNTDSKIIFDKNNKKSKTKTVLYSAIISLCITIIIVYISIKVDKEDEKNK